MNEIQVDIADEDGFIITDREQDRCYIYYEEIDELFQKIRKVAYEYNNIRGQHSPSSKSKSVNAKPIYKTFENYKDYIQSDEWKQKRKLRLQYDAHRCVNCGSRMGLEVHHINYDNFGNEDVKNDLRTLCNNCHNKKTQLDKKRKYVITECG